MAKRDETVQVGCARLADGQVSWELRVCGVTHAAGVAGSASHALLDAGFALRDASVNARSGVEGDDGTEGEGP